MTRIILIRHGESIGNALQTFLGHTDLDLTERGFLQAELTAEFLRDAHIDCVYSSDLLRAMHTVAPIAAQRGLPVLPVPELREIYAGAWEGMKYEEIQSVFSAAYNRWKQDLGNARCTDGESVAELQQRVHKALWQLARAHEGQTICIGTHATPLRVMHCIWNHLPLTEAKNVSWVYNASVTVVDYNGEDYQIQASGLCEHLAGIDTAVSDKI